MWVGVTNTLVCCKHQARRHPATHTPEHSLACEHHLGLFAISSSAKGVALGGRTTLSLSLLPARRLDCLPLGLNCATLSSSTQFPNFSIYGVRERASERYTSFAAEGRPESMRNSIDFARLLQERCARFARINLARRTNRKCLCTTGSFATGSKYSEKFRLLSQNNCINQIEDRGQYFSLWIFQVQQCKTG